MDFVSINADASKLDITMDKEHFNVFIKNIEYYYGNLLKERKVYLTEICDEFKVDIPEKYKTYGWNKTDKCIYIDYRLEYTYSFNCYITNTKKIKLIFNCHDLKENKNE